MQYREAIDWLYGTQLFGIKLGLDNVARLLRESGLLPPAARIAHVAGTNGKGSICAMLDAICRQAGVKAGLFTSPHLISFRERIRVDGEMIPEGDAAAGLALIRDRIADWDPHPTFFEIALALALWHFQRAGAQAIILETGMGGRLDATNALTPCVCAFGPIAMDHAKWLGDTLERIAEEKAGILKPGVPAFAFQQSAAALTVLQSRAAAVGAPLSVLAAPWLGAAGLEGTHQRENAAVAAAAARALLPGVSDNAVALGIAAASWPARFQRLRDGRLIVDGAHNENAAAALCAAWRDAFGEEKASVVFGAVEDKDIRAVAAAIAPVAGDWVLVKAPGSRGIPAADLIGALPPGATYRIADSVAGALSLAEGRQRRVLVAGSLYLAGEVLALQGGAAFEASAQ